MTIEKNKLRKMERRSLVMIVIMAFILFCFESLAMVIAKSWEDILILIAGFIVAIIMILFLIYYNNMITIYKVEYKTGSVIFYSTLKKYYINGQVRLEETVKSFVIKTAGKRFLFPKYNKFPVERDRCFTSDEMEEILNNLNQY